MRRAYISIQVRLVRFPSTVESPQMRLLQWAEKSCSALKLEEDHDLD